MSAISASEARKRFAAVIETAQHEAVFVERRGETEAVVISPAEYHRLMEAAEEAEDVAAFDAAMAEEGPNIPWEQVKTDLGW
ncbi:type II toxin-antitoxin system Phd/YefM family antitoxin [Ornithinimicrobium sp. F0845]|uniref:type II toxin-antitoxin system Phd/YefM family antitoxin n=1 Tax=Ornithinimicrobium sp. F0845 TaxID=2926412 RepID=UPI001FF4D95A|nr:type II toxin-antitoxin system Phd/YefM family antitoxin [Ornithinimicrobium sp. F0845]MCK0112848.1 type II toxin-antitoxin system Phd/YefM family antitoxin [Ornithinimicrobium sp. F0845]